jgi:hypothetical protein
MHPKNIMEYVVRETLDSRRREDPGGDPACWCPLCIADMQALALSSLPPRYVTRRGGVAIDAASAKAVRDEVEHAVRQVGSHPKHAPGSSGAAPETVAVVNFPFETSFTLIDERMRSHPGSCECWDCRCDAVAFALNRFPPQYGVAVGGASAFTENSRRQMADELVAFLDLGVRITAAHPRHSALP